MSNSLGTESRIPHIDLYEMYHALPRKYKTPFKDQVLESCMVSRNVFNNWVLGKSSIPKYLVPQIIEIYHAYVPRAITELRRHMREMSA